MDDLTDEVISALAEMMEDNRLPARHKAKCAIVILEAHGYDIGRWEPASTLERDSKPKLVWLEEASTGCHVHAAVYRPNIAVIGHHFAFDMPKPTHWRSPPPAPREENSDG